MTQMPHQREKDNQCHFRYLGLDTIYPENQVTSASVIIYTPEGYIIGVDLTKRGYDIPGGHREREDISILDTIRREAREEANVEFGHPRLKLVIESDYYGKSPEDLTYILIYEAELVSMGDFNPTDEVRARVLTTSEEIIEKHTGNKDLIRAILSTK